MFGMTVSAQVEKNEKRIIKTLNKQGYDVVQLEDFGRQWVAFDNRSKNVYKVDPESGYVLRNSTGIGRWVWVVVFTYEPNHDGYTIKRAIMLSNNKKTIIKQ